VEQQHRCPVAHLGDMEPDPPTVASDIHPEVIDTRQSREPIESRRRGRNRHDDNLSPRHYGAKHPTLSDDRFHPFPCKRVADGSPPVPLPVPPSPAPGRTSGTCRHRTTSVLLTDARARASAYCQVSALATRRTSLQPVGCPTWQHFGCSKVETPGWPLASPVGVLGSSMSHIGPLAGHYVRRARVIHGQP